MEIDRHVNFWYYNKDEKQFVVLFEDKRRRFPGIRSITSNCSDYVQEQILSLGIPETYECKRTRKLFAILKRKFEDTKGLPVKRVKQWVWISLRKQVIVTFVDGTWDRFRSEWLAQTECYFLLKELVKVDMINQDGDEDGKELEELLKTRVSSYQQSLLLEDCGVSDDEDDEGDDGYFSD